jgi:hypothetical protein
LDSVVNNFRCGLYGHSDVVIIHKYESTYREKFFGEIDGEKFKQVNHARWEHYQAKCVCRACGETFLARYAIASLPWQ